MTPKRLYNFMIDPDILEALKRLKELRPHVSEGHLVREALREYLQREGVMKAPPRPRRKRERKG